MEGTCDFTLGEYDGDQAEFYREQVVTARKAHKCYECHAEISPGEKHQYVSGKWDGDFQCYRFCLACEEISEEFHDGARAFGCLWEGMEENWSEGAPLQPCLNRVHSVAAKKKMRDQWKQFKSIP